MSVMMTFESKRHKEFQQSMDRINNDALPRANSVAAYSPSDGLK